MEAIEIYRNIKKRYYHVKQGYRSSISIKAMADGFTGVGTDGCVPCLGFYVQLEMTVICSLETNSRE